MPRGEQPPSTSRSTCRTCSATRRSRQACASCPTTLLGGFILAGIGIGFINPPLTTAAIGVVEGTAVGIAGLGAILQAKLPHNLGPASFATAAGRNAYIDAFNVLLKVGAAVAYTGAVSALVLIRRRDFVSAAA